MNLKFITVLTLILFILSISVSAQWYQQNSGTINPLYSVSFFDENHGWVAGAGILLRTTNGGSDWIVQLSSMFGDAFVDIQSLDVNNGKVNVMGHVSSAIYGTTDGGNLWWLLSSDFGLFQFAVFFINQNKGWTVGYNGTVYKSTDGGFNWVSQNSGTTATLTDVYFTDENNGILIGRFGTIRRTTNGGENWMTQPSGTINDLSSVSFADSSNGWVVGINGTILRTTNGGTEWNFQQSGIANSLRSVCFKDLNNGTVVGSNGKILKTTNGGQNWFEQFSGTTSDLFSLSFIDSLVGTAVGDNGTIIRTINGGIPVELTSFTALVSQIEKAVQLIWTTATEINNSGFNVEKLTVNSNFEFRNSNWEAIGFVPGFGTTTEPKSYSFTDENVTTGTYKYRLKQIDFDGSFEYSNEIEVDVDFTPKEFVLYQNYPNPFNPSTTIKFTVPSVIASGAKQSQFVTLKVYDVLGNEVATLVNEEKQPGVYEVEFNSHSDEGQNLSSGIYFYQLKADYFTVTKKMIIIK